MPDPCSYSGVECFIYMFLANRRSPFTSVRPHESVPVKSSNHSNIYNKKSQTQYNVQKQTTPELPKNRFTVCNQQNLSKRKRDLDDFFTKDNPHLIFVIMNIVQCNNVQYNLAYLPRLQNFPHAVLVVVDMSRWKRP